MAEDLNTPEFQARLWAAARAGVEDAVATLRPDAATVTWSDDARRPAVEIRPHNPEAATVSVAPLQSDEVHVQAGDTSFVSFGDPERVRVDLAELLTAIFEGRMEAATRGNRARITTGHGVVQVGDRSFLPMPWAWRRPRIWPAY